MNPLRCIGLCVAFVFGGVAAAAPDAEGLPKGTYTIKGPDDATWAVTLADKGKFKVTRDGMVGVEGTYKVEKDQITFTDEKGPFALKGEDKSGTYKWKREGKKVTFTKVKDPSAGRARILTSGPWTMKE